jgi:hypothetical protein
MIDVAVHFVDDNIAPCLCSGQLLSCVFDISDFTSGLERTFDESVVVRRPEHTYRQAWRMDRSSSEEGRPLACNICLLSAATDLPVEAGQEPMTIVDSWNSVLLRAPAASTMKLLAHRRPLRQIDFSGFDGWSITCPASTGKSLYANPKRIEFVQPRYEKYSSSEFHKIMFSWCHPASMRGTYRDRHEREAGMRWT